MSPWSPARPCATAPRMSPFASATRRPTRAGADRKLATRARTAGRSGRRGPRSARPERRPRRPRLVRRCRRDNMAIYASRVTDEDKEVPRRLGAQLGLATLDTNFLADEDGITRIAVTRRQGEGGASFPTPRTASAGTPTATTTRPELRIRAMLLHCVRDAASGGDTALLDHELAYLLLREDDPGPRARADAARRPHDPGARGRRRRGARRRLPARCSPSTRPRATCTCATPRGRAAWPGRTTRPPRRRPRACSQILDGDADCVLRTRLAPGMGLVCNNVLHERSAFEDAAGRRAPALPRPLRRAHRRHRTRLGRRPCSN